MSAVIVIPARYDSTRFPGKPLALLKGIPVIQHVYQNSMGAASAEEVLVATDSETILEKVLSFGGRAVMTSAGHVSGTDRVAEIARSLSCDIIVNVQGDEPLIRSEMIDDAIGLLVDVGGTRVDNERGDRLREMVGGKSESVLREHAGLQVFQELNEFGRQLFDQAPLGPERGVAVENHAAVRSSRSSHRATSRRQTCS